MKLIILLIMLFVVSCSVENKSGTDVHSVIVEINLNNLNKADLLFDQRTLNESTFVKLETNNECLLGNIIQLEVFDDLIFILDSNYKLSVFGMDGTFHNSIGQIGRGPKEMLSSKGFYINKSLSYVGIFDPMSTRIYRYSFDGTFLKYITLDPKIWYKVDEINFFGEGVLMLSYINEESIEFNYSLVKESDYSLIRHILPYMVRGNRPEDIGNSRFTSTNNHFYATAYLSDTIYTYQEKEFYPAIVLETGLKHANATIANKGGPFDFCSEAMFQLNAQGYSRGIFAIFATNQNLLIQYRDNDFYEIFWNINRQAGTVFHNRDRSNILTSMELLKTCTDDAFVCVIPALRALDDQKGKHALSDPNLLDVMNNIKDDDNPVIAFYRFSNIQEE